MNDLQSLIRRVEQLEARAEISELCSAYAIACDEHDMRRLTSLFAPDAELDSPSKLLSAKGRDAIVQNYIKLFKIRGPGMHWTHDHFVHFDANDSSRASGVVLSHAETCPGDQGSVAAMRYEDEYVRLDGRWVFRKRVLKFLYYTAVKDYAQILRGPIRVTTSGLNNPGDLPESSPGWQAFEREHRGKP